ncbi:hypothetical protein NP493_556g00024 [Ridgeia piscesae]|uniref:Uncharacterized protein n=1 Tax=Ridgeia piscesae TaxID=27915 RepID=A0AAD9NSV5_RIDPI|nr:hypothetical protein NP493_556g00024 [Ridgeia piscesae]
MDEAQIDEVLRMLPYASREDLSQEGIVTREEGVEERCGLPRDESPPPYPLTTSRVTAASNFACELPSPPKKRKFVFRRIDKATTQKRNDFYSDSSDVELDDIDTGHDIKLNQTMHLVHH